MPFNVIRKNTEISIQVFCILPLAGGPSDPICDIDMTECAEQVDESLDRDTPNYRTCDCYRECRHIDFREYYVYQERINVENNTDDEYETGATISLADYEYTAYKLSQSHEIAELLSNIGGFLGLFLGMSVLSVVETIYFFTLRFIDDLWYKPKVLSTTKPSI